MSMNPKTHTQTGQLFKQTVPKMPQGYYSGDKPNPNLRAFVEQHLRERSYDPAKDDYDVPPFDRPIETTKATAIYNMHTYWSKKPHDAIRQYIQHYTQPGDLVLDPLCGSGGTALAALMEGRKAIGIDRSPAAAFITKNYCTPVNVEALRAATEQLKTKVKPEIEWLYETRCHLTDKPATIGYTVYSQIFQCLKCMNKVPLFDCIPKQRETSKGSTVTVNLCPRCYARGISEEIDVRGERFGCIPVLVSYLYDINRKVKRAQRTHNDKNAKAREYFQKFDCAKIREIQGKTIPHWYPTRRMMNAPATTQRWALLWRPYLKGRDTVDAFFTKANLWALAAIWNGISCLSADALVKDALRFAFTSSVLNASDMYRYRESGKGGLSMGTLYIGPVFQVMNAWRAFADKVTDLFRGYGELALSSHQVNISCQSTVNLSSIPSGSIDYVFTDPPYSWKVQYVESHFIWEAWLDADPNWHRDEIIVNEVRGKSEEEWATELKAVMAELFRVLKPGRCLSLCYHDTSEGTWERVQDMMTDVGFVPEHTSAALFIDTGQKAWKQIVADKVSKRDLVINFRKLKPGASHSNVVITGEEDQQTFRQKVQTVIREFLQVSPGSTKDRIYDTVVSLLVRKGQMQTHNFDELLGEVAEEVKEPVRKNLFENEEPDLLGSHQVGRWHLKESEAGAEEAERATADSAGTRIYDFLAKRTAAKLKESETRFGHLQAEIAERRAKLQAVDQGTSDESRGKCVREIRELTVELDKLTAERAEWERQALDYSQIFEFYVAAVNPKPKATLEEILEDYCYQTDEGNWRPPLTEPEKKDKGSERQRAVRRKIQRFCNLLEAREAIPENQRPDTQTLAEWIRHCRRTGLHAQGKLLYERGGDLSALSDQAQVEVEEDYQVCVKHLGRGAK